MPFYASAEIGMSAGDSDHACIVKAVSEASGHLKGLSMQAARRRAAGIVRIRRP